MSAVAERNGGKYGSITKNLKNYGSEGKNFAPFIL